MTSLRSSSSVHRAGGRRTFRSGARTMFLCPPTSCPVDAGAIASDFRTKANVIWQTTFAQPELFAIYSCNIFLPTFSRESDRLKCQKVYPLLNKAQVFHLKVIWKERGFYCLHPFTLIPDHLVNELVCNNILNSRCDKCSDK